MTAAAEGGGPESRAETPSQLGSDGPPRALYIHFPFCAHRCHYCDFSVKRALRPPVGEWLMAVSVELAWWFETCGWTSEPPLDTVFVGGGTPSLLGAEGMEELRAAIEARFRVDPAHTEWTAEANPASFDRALGEAWRATGVNRVSLGVQALDDRALTWLGRLHDRSDAEAAVRAAREAGFDRVSVDLMFGLPDEVDRVLAREVDDLIELGVGHVSLYGLTIEPRTPLAEWVRMGRARPASGERYAAEYRLLAGRLRGAGFDHYEVSNFARDGEQCRHNWYYWNREPYLGIGPSGHGFLPPYRVWNVFRWDRYERASRTGAGPLDGWERLGGADERLERIWLGLRTTRGVPAEQDAPEARRSLKRWERAGWLERRSDRWLATVDGWLRMDEMVSEIAEREETWLSRR